MKVVIDQAERNLRRRIVKLIIALLALAGVLAIILLLILNSLHISFFSIRGDSMEPTLSDRDSVILRQKSQVKDNYLVFFHRPNAWSYADAQTTPRTLVKRIAAVPGQRLTYDGHEFRVNGKIIYDTDRNNYSCPDGSSTYSHVLTAKEIFVMGDNASVSLDSRRVFCDGHNDFYVPEPLVIDFGVILFKF